MTLLQNIPVSAGRGEAYWVTTAYPGVIVRSLPKAKTVWPV